MTLLRTKRPGAFARLAWSNFAAQSAEQIGLAAAPIVAVLALGASEGETGWLQTAQTLPFLLLAIPAGLLVDRTSRIGLLVGAETLRAASLVALLALMLGGGLSLPVLAVLGFVGATGTVMYSVAAPALVPALVPRTGLGAANGRLELARSIAFAAGPTLGGALVGWAGGPAAFAGAALLSAAAATMLARLPEPPRAPHPALRPLAALREGAALVFGHPLLRPILVTSIVFNIAFFLVQAVFVAYAARHLRLDAAGIGLTLGTAGFGMVAAALLSGAIAALLPLGIVIAIGPACGFAASILIAATIAWPSPFLAAAGFALVGAGPLLWVIHSTTLRQAVTPDGMLGRVSALMTTAGAGSRPVGSALGAGLGVAFGAETCLLVAVVLFLVQFVIILASPVRRLTGLSDTAA